MFMSGNRLWAIDAATGQPAAGFGEKGSVEVGISYGGTPTIYRNVAIIGAASTENPKGPAKGNPRAFDVISGKKLWEFQTVPQQGEPFNETWWGGWLDRQGTNMWAFAAPVDVERGIVYLPIAGPAANYYGGDRPGANLFGNSIVAVDAQTGKYMWHFQTVHHDLWDIDLPSAGALIPVQQNGKPVPAIAHVGKSSYFYLLNRVTGVPLIPVEERPVPKGDVPGEYYHPTQPFPVRPEPLSPTSFNADTDLVRPEDTTPEHAAACRAMMEKAGGYINLGPFTPFMFHEDGTPPRSTIQLPGGTGGVNWGGVAADPTTGLVYANAQTASLVGWVEKVDPAAGPYPDSFGSDQPYNRASVNGKGPFFSFTAMGMPCMRPPWGQLVAVNATTGEIAWRSVLGIRENLPEDKQLVGNSGSAGPTVTGGGLVFVGATNDRRFRAFDAKSGKQLWEAQLGGNANANPMTYTGRDGKQYVAVISGTTVNAFALP
jgi:quinoprotein glucose dehydrogenase